MATRKSGTQSSIQSPSRLYKIAVSFFALFYILFSLQASVQLAMKVKWFKVWPWHAWNMFQRSSSYNYTLEAEGINKGGEIVKVDLDSIFKYRRGSYERGRYSEMRQLKREYGKQNRFKNTFSFYVVEKYNAKARTESEKLKILDLYTVSWPKGVDPDFENVRKKLVHRWTE